MVAGEPPTNRKRIPVVDASVTIQGFSFSGGAVSQADDNNGAGVRYEAGNLSLLDDSLTHNQNGLPATPFVAGMGTIDIENFEFAFDGAGDG